MNDDALMNAIKNGTATERSTALRQLFKDPVVVGYIRKNCNDTHRAEEVLQESLIAFDAAVRRGSFSQKSTIRTYLIGICRNMLSQQFKMAHHYVLQEDFTDGEITGTDRDATPEEIVLMSEASEEEQHRDSLLHAMLEKISERCRKLLYWQYWDKLTTAQIGELRGQANPQMVRNDMADCRQQLRRHIAQEPYLLQLFGGANR
jgi:RNA polymerase sigma factor (sigma-70 family)